MTKLESGDLSGCLPRLPRVPPVYRIQEGNSDEMDSFYYEQELLSINRELN